MIPDLCQTTKLDPDILQGLQRFLSRLGPHHPHKLCFCFWSYFTPSRICRCMRAGC